MIQIVDRYRIFSRSCKMWIICEMQENYIKLRNNSIKTEITEKKSILCNLQYILEIKELKPKLMPLWKNDITRLSKQNIKELGR